MVRFRFRPRRINFRRARRVVRAVSGQILAKRIVLDGITIPAESAANYDNPLVVDLLECTEAQDEAAESDGTTIADCPLYSKIVSMKLDFSVRGSAGQNFRWMLQKQPNGDTLTSSLINASFHGSDDTQNQREARKNTIAKGYFLLNSTSLQGRIPIFVKRQAMQRVGSMREGDQLAFLIASDSAGTAALHGFGTIWVRANA